MPVSQPSSVQLHRCRFLEHTPSPITALSFAPLPLPPSRSKGKKRDDREEFGAVILARENGEVEIWQWEREDEESGVGNWVLDKVRQAPR
jgi:U3 small nucleolar RNA-associated protein 4